MRPNPFSCGINRRVVLAILSAVALQLSAATAQEVPRPTDSGFSFAVYGDSRSMMYLPYKSDQEADARQLMVDMFELVLPEKVAAEVVKKVRTRLVAERADLKSPLLSSNTDAEREAELTQLNGKLYTVEKAQFAKSCPLVANTPPSPPSAVVR